MKRIYICLPFEGEVEDNLALARSLCRKAIDKGYAPFTAHLIYPEIIDMDDSNEKKREQGLECALCFLKACDEVWAFIGKGETVPLWPPHLPEAWRLGKRIEFIRGVNNDN
jgi:hypothetical protein